jgi:hypothetical protein
MHRGEKRIDLEDVHARIQQHGADAQLTRGEAAALIADRIKDPYETAQTARNRIAMQMDRSRAASDDVTAAGLARLPSGKFTADEIARWAMRRYGDVFNDIPTRSRVTPGRLSENIPLSDRCSGESLPGTVEASHVQIKQLRAELKRMRVDAERANEERKRKLAANFKKPK